MKSPVYFAPAHGGEPPDAISRKARDVLLRTGFPDLLAPEDLTALKIHFGERDNAGYIRPRWLQGIVREVRRKAPRAFLTDSNTLYVGRRSNSVEHIRLAWDHGFTPEAVDAPVIIADGLIGRDKREAAAGEGRVRSAKIAAAILQADAILCLTHLTGHVQTGIGGALKNLGMGCASRAGKLEQHATVHPRVNPKKCRNCGLCLDLCPAGALVQAEGHVTIDGAKCIGCGECLVVCKHGAVQFDWDSDARRLQEKMAEYARLVAGHFKGKAGYVSFLIRVTKDCDCMAKAEPPIVSDIGILASADPVAIDRAAADLVIARSGGSDVFRAGYDIDWSIQLDYGEKIGLGRNAYALIEIDAG